MVAQIFVILSLVWCVIVRLSEGSSGGTVFSITTHDEDADPYPAPCQSTSNCSLRSAWAECAANISMSPCVLQLPADSRVVFDPGLGPLALLPNMSVTIAGQNSTIVSMSAIYSDFLTYYSDSAATSTGTPAVNISGIAFEGFVSVNVRATSSASASSNSNASYFGNLITLRGSVWLEVASCAFHSMNLSAGPETDGSGSIFHISNQTSGSINISSTSIYASIMSGSAVYLEQAAQVRIAGCSFVNLASSTSGPAVHLAEHNSDISLRGLVIVNTTANSSGGAVCIGNSNQRVVLSSSSIKLSQAVDMGGAVAIGSNNTDIILSALSISSASTTGAAGYGGGIAIGQYNDMLTIANCTISLCSSMNGGGIALWDHARASLANITLLDCSAALGGGMYVRGDKSQTNSLLLTNIVMFGMTVSAAGGGIYVSATCSSIVFRSIRIADAIVFGDLAPTPYINGGCMFIAGSGHIFINIIMLNCSASSVIPTFLTYGGGIYVVSSSNLIFRKVSISSSSAVYGGGVYIDDSSQLSFTDTLITTCSALNNGGGMMIGSSNRNLSFAALRVTYCTAATSGGGMSVGSAQYITLNDFHVLNCTTGSVSGNGGGVFISGGDNVKLTNGTISTCSAALLGGGLSAESTTYLTLNTVLIEDCDAKYGGGLSLASTNETALLSSNILSNTASQQGGGLYISSSNDLISLASSNISFNQASKDGGGIFMGSSNSQINIMDARTYSSMISVILSPCSNTFPGQQFNGAQMLAIALDPASGIVLQPNPMNVNQLSIFDSAGRLIKRYNQNDDWPGMSTAPLMVKSDRIGRIVYQTIAAGICTISLTVRIYPLYAVPTNSMRVTDNSAGHNGGGIRVDSSNQNINLFQVIISGNEAENDGGGMACDEYNEIIQGYQATFLANRALSNGGGLMFNRWHSSVVFTESIIDANVALLDGGGLYLNSNNELTLDTCQVINNTCSTRGGGIATVKKNSIQLSNSVLQANHASHGGGVTLMQASLLTCIGNVSFDRNHAVQAGGALLSLHTSLIGTSSSQVSFRSNQAAVGSAMFYHDLHIAGNETLANTAFIGNHATVGGTVFWLHDDTMTSEPPGLRSSTIKFLNNTAGFGPMVATQAVNMSVPSAFTQMDYGGSLEPLVSVSLQDYYGQQIQSNYLINVAVVSTTSADCKGNPVKITGTDATSGVLLEAGSAAFVQIEVDCAPNGFVHLQFTSSTAWANNQDISLISSSGYDYSLSANTTVTFRGCIAGEFIDDSKCTSCSTNTYSLYPDSTACVSCKDKNGVDRCFEDTLIIKESFWRRSNVSSSVQACLLASGSCQGNASAGDASCAAGYEGDLCAICSEGYYLSYNECNVCPAAADGNDMLIYVVILVASGLVCLLLFAYLFSNWLLRSASMRTTLATAKHKLVGIMNKLKIVLATYQIVGAVHSVLDINLPSSFTRFSSAINFLNFSYPALIPLACSRRYNFMDSLLVTTLAPIAISVLLAVAFVIERALHGEGDTDAVRGHYVPAAEQSTRSQAAEAMRNKYLTAWFFLTYLVLPSVTTEIFKMFVCTNTDPDNEIAGDNLYLTADMTISCTSDYYRNWLIYGIAMVFVYPVGVPLIYLVALYQNKSEISSRLSNDEQAARATESMGEQAVALQALLQEHDAQQPSVQTRSRKEEQQLLRNLQDADGQLSPGSMRLAFLWRAYEPRFWYWELVETSRRMLLTAVLSVTARGSSQQNVFAVMLAVAYMVLYGATEPYDDYADDVTAMAGQLQVFLTFFTALVIENNLVNHRWNPVLGVLLVLVNLAVTVVAVYSEASALKESREREEMILSEVEMTQARDHMEQQGGGDVEEGAVVCAEQSKIL